MEVINKEDKVVVPFGYVAAVDWLKTSLNTQPLELANVMLSLGIFFGSIEQFNSQIFKYEESKNEN